jgi:hypothetical protein
MNTKLDYGLELTNNSKVGWAFSLPRTETCINATALCKRFVMAMVCAIRLLGRKLSGVGTLGLRSSCLLRVDRSY